MPKLVEQYHEILSVPEGLLETIEMAGRTCYQSEPKGNPTRFVKMLKDRGHHAMLEFGDIIVRFVTNRGVLAELTRHRVASYAVESTRYVRYDGDMEFIRPVWDGDTTLWQKAMERAEETYGQLLAEGWRPEQAREVLPNSLKTEIIMKASVREWMHVLKLRTSPKAHPQIRALMLDLQKELREILPVLF